MDNQQLKPEQGRVQRSSRKRVLDENIIWETPRLNNAVYIYKLHSTISDEVKYIGITSNPESRYINHVKPYNLREYSPKNSWVESLLFQKENVVMTIFDKALTLEDALSKEEHYINTLPNLLNVVLFPTKPNAVKCYLYNIHTKKVTEFESHSAAAFYLNVTPSAVYRKIIKSEWIFSVTKSINLKPYYKIKAVSINGGEPLFFITQKETALAIGCSKSMVNLCCMGQRNSTKSFFISKIKNDFPILRTSKKSITCLNDNKVFESILEASLHYKIDASGIVKVCKNKRKTVAGYKFVYDDMIQPYLKE